MAKYVEKPEAKQQAGVTMPAVAQAPPPAAEPPVERGVVPDVYKAVRRAARALSDVIQEGSAVVGSALFRAKAAVDDITHASKLDQVLVLAKGEVKKGIELPEAIVSSALAVERDYASAARLIYDAAVALSDANQRHVWMLSYEFPNELLDAMRAHFESDYDFLELGRELYKCSGNELILEGLVERVSPEVNVIWLIPLFEMGYYNEKYLAALRDQNTLLFASVLASLSATRPSLCTQIYLGHPEWFPPGALLRELIRKDPSFYTQLDGPEREDPDIIAAAVDGDGMMLQYVPKEKWTDELVERAVRSNPMVVGKIKWGDMDRYYRIAVETDGRAISILPSYLTLMKGELMQVALKTYPDAWLFSYEVAGGPYKYLGELTEAIRRDPTLYERLFMHGLAQWDSLALDLLPLGLRDPNTVPLILAAYRNNKEVALATVSVDGRHIRHLPPDGSLRRDPEIIEAALRNNPAAVHYLHVDDRYDPRWRPLLDRDIRTRFSYRERRLPHKIRVPERFDSDDHLQKMLRTRTAMERAIAADPKNPEHPPQRLHLFIYAVADHNDAFLYNNLDEAIEQGDAVVYYEVTERTEVSAILARYLPLLRSGDHVVIRAHGTQTSQRLTNADSIDLSNEKEIAKAFADAEIPDGVRLYLSSCSNGKGGPEYPDNMMNMWYRLTGKKWHVYALSDNGCVYYAGTEAYPANGPFNLFGSAVVYHLLPYEEGFFTCYFGGCSAYPASLVPPHTKYLPYKGYY